MPETNIMQGAEPFFFEGNEVGCLVSHGFTGTTQSMRFLGEYLAGEGGLTVVGPRLEGHGKIDIFLDEEGNVANAYLLIPELRGFEKFAEGRPVEEMARITPRTGGVVTRVLVDVGDAVAAGEPLVEIAP